MDTKEERKSSANKRINSGRAAAQPASAGRKSATSIKNDIGARTTPTDLLSREEEYKKLNAALEAKTADLVREAEDVLKGQESILSQSRLLDNINTEEFLKEFDDNLTERNEARPDYSRETSANLQYAAADLFHSQTASKGRGSTQMGDGGDLTERSDTQLDSARMRPHSAKLHSAAIGAFHSRPESRGKKPLSAKAKAKAGKAKVDNVAVPDDTFMTDFKDFSLKDAIDNIEVNSDDDFDDHNDVLPQAAQDMGSEAQIRFLKAKLRVMQEEMDRLGQECNRKDEEQGQLTTKVKNLEDERGRLHRTNAAQASQIDKFKKIAEDSKSKADSLETQLSATKKELDQIKRTQKQQDAGHGATEVRLNRALEELEKYKEQMARTKTSSREMSDQEKRKVDQLMSDNKRLEKQKNELMTGFKKQLKLIDILKRQKMHIEAAKMLAFSEEEFVKALEWGS